MPRWARIERSTLWKRGYQEVCRHCGKVYNPDDDETCDGCGYAYCPECVPYNSTTNEQYCSDCRPAGWKPDDEMEMT